MPELNLETVLQKPTLMNQLQKEAFIVERSHDGLEDALGYVKNIENSIRQDGWKPQLAKSAYHLMLKIYEIGENNPGLREMSDSLIEQIYETVRKHKHSAYQYDALKRVLGEYNMEQIGKIVPSPFRPHETELSKVYENLKNILSVPEQFKALSKQIQDYKNQERGMNRYLTGLITFGMITGTLAAFSAVKFSATGNYISTVKQSSGGLFVLLLVLIVFALVTLRKIRIKS